MAVYKLSPIDLDHPLWERSSYRGNCQATALSEAGARDAAAGKYSAMAKTVLGAKIEASPWQRPDLVDCTEVAYFGEPLAIGSIIELNGSGGPRVA